MFTICMPARPADRPMPQLPEPAIRVIGSATGRASGNTADDAVAADDDTGPPRGCGWFESSRELVQGTRVIEHRDFSALSFEVPLAWQLAACC